MQDIGPGSYKIDVRYEQGEENQDVCELAIDRYSYIGKSVSPGPGTYDVTKDS